MSNVDTSGIMNTLYHAAVISGLSMAYSMVSYKLLKIKSPELSRLNVEDGLKLTGIVSASIATRDWLVAQNMIPANVKS